jgi:four helix bundle protein
VSNTVRKNVNRGYMQLRVWQDAVEFYRATCQASQPLPYDLRRIVSQQIGSVDSIHRNIAEGYCRRSLREYMQFPNYAIASAGESVSGLHACRQAGQITSGTSDQMDALAYRLENGLKRLIESLQRKQGDNSWEDSFIVRESNAAYGEPDAN